MADFDLSLAITADGDQAAAEINRTTDSVERMTAAEFRAAGGAEGLAAAAQRESAALGAAAAAASRGAAAADRMKQSNDRATQAVRAHTVSLGAQRASMANVGQQFQDITMQAALGVNAFTILAQQGGQLAFALSNVGGTAGKVASFFAGPFGSILIAATAIIGGMAGSLLGHASASETALDASDALSEGQGALGKIFDLTTGQIERNTEALRINARMKAISLRATAMEQEQSGKDVLGRAGHLGVVGRIAQLTPRILGGYQADQKSQRALLDAVSRGVISAEDAIKKSEGARWGGLAVSPQEFREALSDIINAREARRIAGDIDKSLDTGSLASRFLRDTKARKPKAPPKPKDMSGLEEFGEDAAKRIRNIAAAFSDIPPQQEKVGRALGEMDDLLDDIARKKPPGFEQLIEDGERAKDIIRDGINVPYRQFLENQEKSLELAHLIALGREDEAQALQYINQLEAQVGPLTEERKDAILASVQAIKAEQREAEKLQAIINRQLEAVNSIKEAVRGIFSPGGLKDLPGRVMGAVEKYVGDFLFDKAFGKMFQGLEDQIKGTSIVEEAGEKFRQAIIETANPSLDKLADSANRAAEAMDRAARDPLAPQPEGEPGQEGDIVVTGYRNAKKVPTDPAGFFAHIAEELAKGVLGEKMAKTIGDIIGRALEGAAIGSMVAGTLFGNQGKGSQIGSSIGGAIGNIAGTAIGKTIGGTLGSAFGPIGSALGGIAGSLLGGLFGGSKKPPSGGTTITNVYDQGQYSGSSSLRNDVNAIAGSIQGGLQDIANALGGGLGAFSVTVGQRHGDWRVNPTGSSLKVKKGAVDFNDDQGAAIAFAIVTAIKEGAITGLSAAVQKALLSSEDLQRSLREATKVQELETLIGGMGSLLEQQFRAFELEAKERVRIAKTYGLDLLKVEELNAKERAELLDSVLKERIGPLKDFLAELDFGQYFAGTLADQRKAIQGEIKKAQADVAAGVDGAADRLANLNRQLLDVSISAYGTAGPEYAADLAAARKAAEDAIAQETERARLAQEQAIAALNAATTQVTLQQETNNLLAQLVTLQGGTPAYSASGGGVSGGLGYTARTVDLAL